MEGTHDRLVLLSLMKQEKKVISKYVFLEAHVLDKHVHYKHPPVFCARGYLGITLLPLSFACCQSLIRNTRYMLCWKSDSRS